MTTLTTNQIENYLHLYLGCELQSEKYPKDTPLDTEILHAIVKDALYDDYKLLLRPLSDMKEDEYEEWEKLNSPLYASDVFTEATKQAKCTQYLLSKSFDIFGLIKSGAAIDKTKLP